MTDEQKPEGVLVDAAKAIGRTVGKVATLVGAGPASEPRKKAAHKPKLAKSNKRRLPRKQKKAQLRAAGKQRG